ncbi:MAG: UDP-N-acetylmuramoylalanyl-D-glutamyl-2,6-diaminopimelate--D-alanyl-D-alanine ligase [Rhizobiales bacterium]|nr:UDP-N-acetylmuramoylalanyl-D-glutamyl-2,6-diaminopimelate--D-alanyl-D-alanine ligase [Hyphomicrobiales bacterium]
MTSNILWQAEELINGLDGKLVAGELSAANGISIDSRDIKHGDAFFAIKGDSFDGHDYTDKAANNGAAVIVISDEKYITKKAGVATILVDDVLASLGRLGVAARKRTNAKIIAVTGSVGKTSTKEFLRACLMHCGKTHASIKSFNNHWGVPISLARMPKDTEFGIFEIGMSHLDEITPLVKMVMPNLAIITTIAPAHLGHFKDLEEIALAKSEIFDGLAKDGIAILNHDNEFFDYLKQKATAKGVRNIQSFGKANQADMQLVSAELLPNGSNVVARFGGAELEYFIGSAGMHQVQNSLGLLLAIGLMGVDLNEILPVLKTIELSDGRGARTEIAIKDGQIMLIDESYNANPASMVAAFSVLSAQMPKNGGRRVAIIGDMLELGAQSAEIHAALAKDIADAKIDVVFACGEDMKSCYNLLSIEKMGQYAQNSSLLAKSILENIYPNDVVMVKGSLGSKMSLIVNKIKNNK